MHSITARRLHVLARAAVARHAWCCSCGSGNLAGELPSSCLINRLEGWEPDPKTVDKTLWGEAVREDVLEKLVKALSQ